MSLKTQLSHLLPVSQAVTALGEDRVSSIVRTLLLLQQQQNGAGGGGSRSSMSSPMMNSSINVHGANNGTKAQMKSPEAIDEETTALVNAMLYTSSSTTAIDSPSSFNNNLIPPPIRTAWKQLTTQRAFLLDKLTLVKFLVPASVQPHSGLGGHMGLFDCLFYALQAKPGLTSSHASAVTANPVSNLGSPATSLVCIPDIVIFLAVCYKYWKVQHPNVKEGNANSSGYGPNDTLDDQMAPMDDIVSISSDSPTVVAMTQWMFIVYDSYQKKGLLVRDTMHRFLSDVYGEDSYKTGPIRDMLEKVFSRSTQMTQREFSQAIHATLVYTPLPSHVLLDWMANLAHALLPIPSPSSMDPSRRASLSASTILAESTKAFLHTIDQQQRFLPQICLTYQLGESRLYEVKRRFHSLVESSTTVIQGDPMSCEMDQAADGSTSSGGNSAASKKKNNNLPKHVIPIQVFVQAVCTPNNESGNGGYFPSEIAKEIFAAVVRMNSTERVMGLSLASVTTVATTAEKKTLYWDLTNVLQFGGLCVRSPDNDDTDLIKWILECVAGAGKGETKMNKGHMSKLLEMMCSHTEFRAEADRYVHHLDDTGRGGDDNQEEESEPMTSAAAAKKLGILPKSWDEVEKPKVPVSALLQNVMTSMESNGNDDTITLDQLLAWHRDNKADQGLGPFLMELRLISSVLFGVPPKLASMEYSIISEIQRRHRDRYPQTDVSRRGPRGTVWYIIDDLWYRTWNGMIEKVSGTPEDGQDLRDKANDNSSPRRLGKISNRTLLRDNGSLALRVDIKWRQHYEILPPLAWSALQAWYDGGPPIYRTVVPYANPATGPTARPTIRTENEIELYPFFVTMFLCDASSRGEARPFQQAVPVSRVNPVRVILVQLCKELDVDPDIGRMWVMDSAATNAIGLGAGGGGGTTSSVDDASSQGKLGVPPGSRGDWLLDLDLNIVEQRRNRINSEQGSGASINLLLELKDEESGLWPRGIDGRQWSFGTKDPNAMETGDGVVGLYNMGNTCYLNSSIQVLSHTPIFKDYFTSKCYLNDINTTNPLGHEGRLAQVIAVLINSLWKRFNQQVLHQPKRVTAPGSYAPVSAPALTPKTFKESLGKFNEHFAGNEQHDAQELLAFVLDGLSEDLNRVVDKPYIQAPDSDGRPDSEIADIWWSNHLKREMSIVVALFTGQYKSLLKCKTCGHESARFEPFSYLQLPLPEDDTIPVNLILYPIRPNIDVMKYSVRVHNSGNLYDVLVALAKVLYADEKQQQEQQDDATNGNGEDENGNNMLLATEKGQPNQPKSTLELDLLYKSKAQNMAVVDMREGYIVKIAPNSWRLPDLQNKDTGELPVLHVYELDEVPKTDDAVYNDDDDDAEKEAVEFAPVLSEEVHQEDEHHIEEKEKSKEVNEEKAKDEEKTDTKGDSTPDDTEADESGPAPKEPADPVSTKNDEEGGEAKGSGWDGVNEEVKEQGKDDDDDDNDDDDESSEESKDDPAKRCSYLALAQRRSELVSKEVLHPLTHRIFGTPLLLRVCDLENMSGRQLYDVIAARLMNFVPPVARKFLESQEEPEQESSPSSVATGYEEKKDDGDVTKAEKRRNLQKTLTDMEEVAAGPVPRYGFRLRLTTRDGRRCSLCPWYDGCIGCYVPDTDELTVVLNGDSLAIDWHFAVDVATNGFGTRATQAEQASSLSPFRSRVAGLSVKNHSSCGNGAKKRGIPGAVTLEDCLDAFSKEEILPEAYCSKCKDFRVQTKRMSLWRLPPVVIIQLKRFQFTQHMRRKLRDFVQFPVEGLDLSRIMAGDMTEGQKGSTSTANTKAYSRDDGEQGDEKKEYDEEAKEGAGNGDAIAAGDDDNDVASAPMNQDDGRTEKLYDLYGVVHHQGALNGGHYVASLKSELDGQWRLYNDAQIYEIHSRDVVDSSAYILFYIRRDVKDMKLSDFWETKKRDGEGLTEQEMNELVRDRSDRCVVS